jgi:hypothetical protein
MTRMNKCLRLGSTRKLVLGGLILAICCAGQLSAAAINGSFGTTGAGVLTFANATNTIHYIDWCPADPASPPSGSPGCGTASNGRGDLQANGGSGTFASQNSPPAGGQLGTILDMKDDPGGLANFTYFPVGAPVAINNWLVLSTLPNLNFQATQLVPQTCAPSATTVCIGAFILTQVGANVTVSMAVNGLVFDTNNILSPASFTDVISGQFNNTDIASVAAAAQTTGGLFSNTWSGSVTTAAVPEPATSVMIGGAMLALGVFLRKRRA